MSEKNNIEDLFQKKFKDFEANAPEDAWTIIEARLNEKKKRRIIPFWWKLSGVAALFLIGFMISKAVYDGEIKSETPLVNESKSSSPKNETTRDQESKKWINNNSSLEDAIVIETQDEKGAQKTTNKKSATKNISAPEKAVSIISSKERKDNNSNKKSTIKKTVFDTKSDIVERESSSKGSLKNTLNNKDHNLFTSDRDTKNTEVEWALNSKKNENKIPKTDIGTPDSNSKNKIETQNEAITKNINLEDLKENINSKIATKETEKNANDTVSKNSIAENVLEELLNEKESKLKQESKRNRWQLSSTVAPIFLGSISNGSPIDSTLSRNSKSFTSNVGFGVGVSYSVNKKFSIRTGLNKVNMSYDTNNILFFTGIQSQNLRNVNRVASSRMIHIQSAVSTNSNSPSETELLPFENTLTNQNRGNLRQEMGYLEMPMEMTYNLFDKKFGLKIIGGFSTLFLQDNSLTLLSNEGATLLGKANNLNDIHFSTNIGLGVKYNFLKSFQFNVEPTFKYQLNTFSNSAGNFRPYIFGIYSGVSYTF